MRRDKATAGNDDGPREQMSRRDFIVIIAFSLFALAIIGFFARGLVHGTLKWAEQHGLMIPSIAVLLFLFLWWTARVARNYRRKYFTVVGFVINVVGIAIGAYFGNMSNKFIDFQLPPSLNVLANIFVTLVALRAIWTLLMLQPEYGFLLKGSLHRLIEEENMQQLNEVSNLIHKAYETMITSPDVWRTLRGTTKTADEFLMAATYTLIAHLERNSTDDVQIRGEVFLRDGLSMEELQVVPRELHNIVYRANESTECITFYGNPIMGIAKSLQFDGQGATVILWSRQTLNPPEIERLWDLFQTFLTVGLVTPRFEAI